MRTIAALLVLLLTACAAGPTPQQIAFNNYVAQNRPLAISGAIKWTSYYEGLYSHALAAGAPAAALNGQIELIDAARALEAGTISEPEFQQRRRRVTASLAGVAEANAAAQRERERQALNQILESNARVAAQNQALMFPAKRAQSYAPMQTQYQAPALQTSARAVWTGSSKIVQTVTNQSGWECQYQYNGQYFTRVFVGLSCPSSIQVQ